MKEYEPHSFKIGFIFILLVLAIVGCRQITKTILPPIYENKYPLIIGILDSRDEKYKEVDSLLINIITNSKLASGVLNEPFHREMVDVIMRVKDVSIKEERKGFFPSRCKLKGKLSIDVLRQDGKTVKTYTVEREIETRSCNPFSMGCENKLLLSDLIITVIEEITADNEGKKFEIVHRIFEERKRAHSSATLLYPILTDFNRKKLSVITTFIGNVPPNEVRFVMSEKGSLYEEPFLSEELYFNRIENIGKQKKWSYHREFNKKGIPLNTKFEYVILTKDVVRSEDVITKGELKTISVRLFRLKQIEVLAHGTIITTFGGFIVLMFLYSL